MEDFFEGIDKIELIAGIIEILAAIFIKCTINNESLYTMFLLLGGYRIGKSLNGGE